MFINHLPKLHLQLSILASKPKLLIPPTVSPKAVSGPIANFSTAALLQAPNIVGSNETSPVEISPGKLFFPPETDVIVETASFGSRILKGSNIVLSKYAGDAQVEQAEFVKSSVNTEDCPADGLPEFALVGRSNVGKSSLLNSIVRRKKLALTSKKPGKTQCINHFRINGSWHLVDLPGYGFQ
ncbi:unnamed protein product [Cuscuta epithymum]|uniref:EngB-type G domain-containing protein n=1 Tax=Cuscuta epithymum TaxID=186058 RepID=A0AAV0EVM7_9ASTE|nr:unnamed protein product [Cuscuta epithymum]